MALTEVDAVRPEMVDEVLQDVHYIGGDVVEGDGQVAAAGLPSTLHKFKATFSKFKASVSKPKDPLQIQFGFAKDARI